MSQAHLRHLLREHAVGDETCEGTCRRERGYDPHTRHSRRSNHPEVPVPVAALAPARPWRRALRRWIGAGAVAVTSVAVAGCGDTTGVSRQLVGQYSTQVFELDYGTFTEDVLAEGGYIDIDLRSNGSTTGTLFVPSTSAGEGDFLADLNGAWSRSGNVVRFSH